ncbi:hypothetical protein ACFLQN_03890 [Candidatus Aenigmatarchaeota archaeon]
MASISAKFYGVIDILAGLLIYFYVPIPDFLKLFILIVMLVKGIPSLFA